MADFRIDIVLPVWNRPVETRSTLVSLIAGTPGARFILVDNGSDRETELILHEFAEGLADGALLIRSERNEGLVPAINRGLARCSLPYVAVVSPGTVVTDGWCASLLDLMDERPDLAAALPPPAGGECKGHGTQVRETMELAFGAMVLRRAALETRGLFDPDLDGDRWCLKDYAHRLHAGGWRVVMSAGPCVDYAAPFLFGSESRRRALSESSMGVVQARWGRDGHFCLLAAATSSLDVLRERMAVVLAAARQGHLLSLLLPARGHDSLMLEGSLPIHTGISIVRLPRFFSQRAATSALAAAVNSTPDLVIVSLDSDDTGPAGEKALSFDRFAGVIAERQQHYFRR
jgi:hypothetical protein